MRLLSVIALLFFVAGVLSCGEGERAGTDTGNPLLAGILTDSQGLVLSGAKVILLDRDIDTSARSAGVAGSSNVIALDTVLTDASGRFEFHVLPRGDAVLAAFWWDSLGALQNMGAVREGDQVALQAVPLVRVRNRAGVVMDGASLQIGIFEAGSVFAAEQGGQWLIPAGERIVDAVQVREGVRGLLQRRVVQLQPGTDLELGTLFSLDTLDARSRWLARASSELKRLGLVQREARRQLELVMDTSVLQLIEEACAQGGYGLVDCHSAMCRFSEWQTQLPGVSEVRTIAAVWDGPDALCIVQSTGDNGVGQVAFQPLVENQGVRE